MTNPYQDLKSFDEKLSVLKSISQQVKPLAKMTGLKVNEALMLAYFDDIDAEVKTYKNWLKDGYRVNKGEKGFAIWSRPIKVEKKNKDQEVEEEYEAFRVAYVFHRSQVSPTN